MRVFKLLVFFCCISLSSLTEASPRPDATFRVRMRAEPESLDWVGRLSSYETIVVINVMEGLVQIDDEFNPRPVLASSWEISEDKTRFLFTLKPGVRWSDGKPLRAQDFVFAWRRALLPKTRSPYAGHFFDIKGAEDFHEGRLKSFDKVGIRALDDSRLEVKLRRAVPNFLQYFYSWVTFPQREDLVTRHAKDWWRPGKLVTLGPYLLASWQKGKVLKFVANPSYHGQAPATTKAEVVIEPDEARARELVTKGKIDALLGATSTDAASYSGGAGGWRVQHFDALNTDYLAFNVALAPVSNSKLRRAIAQALDLSKIAVAVDSGTRAARSMIPPRVFGHETAMLPYDQDKARRLIREAGYSGPELIPPIKMLIRSGRHDLAAAYVRDVLRRTLGISIEIVSEPASEYRKAIGKGEHHLSIQSWWANYPEASCFMKLLSSKSAFNTTRWKSSRYDELLDSAVRSSDPAAKQGFYSEAQRLLLREETVIIPLYHSKTTVLVSPRVRRFEINPLQSQLYFTRVAMKP